MARKPKQASDESPAPQMVVKAYYISEEQYEFLRWRAYKKNINQSASVREGIDYLMSLEKYQPGKATG